MNWLDIIIAIILVINLFVGLKTGLIKMVISFAGLVLGIFLAGRFYQALGDKLTFISSSQVADIAAYVFILIAVMIFASIIAWFLSKIISAIMLGWANGLAGAILGVFVAAVFVGAILAIWAKYGSGGNIISSSLLGRLLLNNFPLVLSLLPGEFDTIKSFYK
jgi:membrane protein required for colicin V production